MIYKYFFQSSVDRSVLNTNYYCKGGKGYCKHTAVVCLFVNAENTCSKTDQAMIRNKPTDAQLIAYCFLCIATNHTSLRCFCHEYPGKE